MKKNLCAVLVVVLTIVALTGCTPKIDERLAGKWEAIAEEDRDFNERFIFEFLADRDNPGVYDGTLRIYAGHKLLTKEKSGIYYKYNTDSGTFNYGELKIIIPGGEFAFGTEFRLEGDIIYGTESGNERPVLVRWAKELGEEEKEKIKKQLAGMWEDVQWKAREEKNLLKEVADKTEKEHVKTYWKFNDNGTIETYIGDVHLEGDGKVYYKEILREPDSIMFYTLDQEGVTIYRDRELSFDKYSKKAEGPEPFNVIATYQLEDGKLLLKEHIQLEKVES